MQRTIILWSARIIGILAILFMMMFSMDCFDEYSEIGDQLTCFVMHNRFIIFPILALVISWKWELIGGVLFILTFITCGMFFKSFTGNFASLVVIAPFLIAGCLFIIHYFLQEKKTDKNFRK